MELEEIANISQVLKTAVIVIGGSAVGYLFYKIAKEKNLIRQAQEENHKKQLEQISSMPERYHEGIFEVEKEVKDERLRLSVPDIMPHFATYITKRTEGLVELIKESDKIYNSAASFVRDEQKHVSRLYIRTNKNSGIAEFPRVLSQGEKVALLNSHVIYSEKYTCYDEGPSMGLLQGWHYNIEVLDGPDKGKKFEEDITV